MIDTELNISTNEVGWDNALPQIEDLSSELLSQTVNFVNAHENLEFLHTEKPVSVNLCLSNDDEVHLLNKEFRQMDKPTNVLSFANIDDEDFSRRLSYEDVIELGDIIIALETMENEAEAKHISLHDHYCHLFIHGILHLLGFDHQADAEAEVMEDYEVQILKLFNINNPYEE